MEQEYEENGLKEGGMNATQKPGPGTGKSNVGRVGSSVGSMAMKIPPKQPSKNQTKQSKGSLKSSQNKNSTENAVSGNQVMQNHANGIQNPKQTKDGQRQTKEEKNSKHLHLPQSSKSKSGSRSNSVSPVNQTAENEEQIKKEEELSNNDPEKTAQSLKQILSVGQPKRIVYSRIQLLNISGNPPSKHRPTCLEKDFDTNGRWDPENWHRSFSLPLSASSINDKVRKFSFSENRDRYQDDTQGGIILGPQRRSFQDGCHVTNSTGSGSRLSKLHAGSPTESSGLNSRHGRPRLVMRQRSETTNDYDGPSSLNRDRQIESASALRTDEFDWERDGRRSDTGRFRERNLSDLRSEPRGRGPRDLPRDLHELRSEYNREHRDNDYKDYRDRDRKFSHNSSRDYGWYQQRQDRQESRQHRYSNSEPEPEWYTAGPTSQFDTIELGGFEEASNDFSSWGGEIPMDDIIDKKSKNKTKDETNDEAFEEVEDSKEKEGEKETETVQTDVKEETEGQGNDDKANEKDESAIVPNFSEMDINDLLNIPGFTGVMEEIINEDSTSLGVGGKEDENQSRFSQWFNQKNQIDNLKKGSGSRGSTPHEELENLAELAAERGLASPVDVESKQEKAQHQHLSNDLIRLLAQSKSGNISPGGNATSLDQAEITKRMLLQQMKAGSVLSVSELEAKTGVRRSPQSYSEVDVQNTDAFNKLVASIRKKDEMKQRIIAQHQTAMKFADSGQYSMNMNSSAINRIPSPEELAVHTQNIFQQALIKRQLEKQKDAYKEKIRLMEQQRREEQLREAIRSADAKMQESKQMNKRELQNLAFMPTSVIRKMHNSTRDAKMQETAEMYNIQQQQMMQSGDGGASSETLAAATASFSAKLANSGKKTQNPMNLSQGVGNDLLARIYQSANLAQQSGSKPTAPRQEPNPGGLRRNASYPDVLMESKINRTSAFHQPAARHGAHDDPMSETERLRNMLALQKAGVQLPKTSSGLKQQQVGAGGLAADFFNNNLLKSEAQSQILAGKFDQTLNKPTTSLVADNQQQARKPAAETLENDLKNQQEVVLLTQAVLHKCGISEEQLSRLTPQQQQAVVSIIRDQYYQLQAQKVLMEKKKAAVETLKAKQGELPPTNSSKNELQNMMMGKNNFGVLKQGEERSDLGQKLSAGQASTVTGIKLNQPQMNTIHGGVPVTGISGLLPNSAHHMSPHPLQLRPFVPPPMAQFIPPPVARGPAMIPTTFLPPPGRMMGPPPPNVSLASPLGQPYQAALMQMQIYQQQHRALLAAAAMQQQQQQAMAAQQAMQAQALAAARQHQQNIKDNSRAGGSASEFHNPLERWFSRDVLSQSQMPAIHHGKQPLTASDIERMNLTNQKQE